MDQEREPGEEATKPTDEGTEAGTDANAGDGAEGDKSEGEEKPAE